MRLKSWEESSDCELTKWAGQKGAWLNGDGMTSCCSSVVIRNYPESGTRWGNACFGKVHSYRFAICFLFVFVFPSVNKWSALQAQNTSLAKNNNRNRTRPVTEVTLGGAVQGVAERRRGKGGGGDERWRDGKDIVAEWPLHCVLSSDGGEVFAYEIHQTSWSFGHTLLTSETKKRKEKRNKATYISQTFRKVEIKQRKRKQPTDIHTQTRQCFSIKKKNQGSTLPHLLKLFFFFPTTEKIK